MSQLPEAEIFYTFQNLINMKIEEQEKLLPGQKRSKPSPAVPLPCSVHGQQPPTQMLVVSDYIYFKE